MRAAIAILEFARVQMVSRSCGGRRLHFDFGRGRPTRYSCVQKDWRRGEEECDEDEYGVAVRPAQNNRSVLRVEGA